ncbi:MAG: coiled-coil domain-containing protein, partial [Limisphaerales bacterium]
MDPLLASRLQPLAARLRRLRFWSQLAAAWVLVGVAGLGLLALNRLAAWPVAWALPVLGGLAFVVGCALLWRHRRREPDWHQLALLVDQRHPELNGVLLTAAQAPRTGRSRSSYLQERIVLEALEHGRTGIWKHAVPQSRVIVAQLAHALALAFLLAVGWGLRPGLQPAPILQASKAVPAPELAVIPGDTSLEKGESLVVLARFGGSMPSAVDLIMTSTTGAERRLPLVRNLSDPVFGGSVPEVSEGFSYRLEYEARSTREFQVTVFEVPRLERADATVTFPEYTGAPPRQVPDTRRISAVEGSTLAMTFQLNKAVTSARLVARGGDGTTIPLEVETNRPLANLRSFPLTTSQTYDLRLVDADGRTNKVPAPFVFEAQKNRLPELRVAQPRGDTRPSPLEEVPFEGTVMDDFGVPAYGFAYTVAGRETTLVELGREVTGKEKRPFQHLLRLEELGLQPDDLVSWFLWADDIGPDGQIRRTTGDLFFAEVRAFDEIYREGQGGGGEGQQQEEEEQSREGGNEPGRLAELQKQIISATWKLQQTAGASGAATGEGTDYRRDVEVVRDAQAQAIEQAGEAQERGGGTSDSAAWGGVIREMEQALERLEDALESPAPLPRALAAEQAAYQALLKLQQREFEVARNRSNQRGQQSGRNQARQSQLDQLELSQSENRYETQRQARPPVAEERREQLQIMNRLQELARRQQDVNERLKELQTALREAPSEREREEIRRRLKRLQEEEQRMLADVDELQQRLDRAQDQSRLAEQRSQLEQAREDLQRAAEAAGEGSVSQALAAGTRAERQMQEMRDQLRQENAGEFSEELRQMRAEARELAREQEKVQQALDALNGEGSKSLSDGEDRGEVLERLARQKERLTNLVDRATELSGQTEASEPLVASELYDTLRRFSQDEAGVIKETQQELLDRGLLTRGLYDRLQAAAERDGAKALELTAEMLRQGYLTQADQAEARARAGIEGLRSGVERAAERVIGDDTEALRQAREQIDELTETLEREIA